MPILNICFPFKTDVDKLTQTTIFSSADFQKNVKFKLNHIENSKTGGQTV